MQGILCVLLAMAALAAGQSSCATRCNQISPTQCDCHASCETGLASSCCTDAYTYCYPSAGGELDYKRDRCGTFVNHFVQQSKMEFYRGKMAKTVNGQTCLPWPTSTESRYNGNTVPQKPNAGLDDGSGLKDYDISIKSFEEMCFRLEQRKITHFWLKESNL